MKRLFLSLSLLAAVFAFSACEGHDAADLPHHYQKDGKEEAGHSSGPHVSEQHAGAKASEHAPEKSEKKAE